MGCDIFREFQEGLLTLNVPITNICNIATDGAPNMIGKKSGFLGLFDQNYPGNNVVFLHCVIHQDALCKSALNMKPVLDAVVKLVNAIRSRGLTHRQFRDFLQSVQSEYSDVLYYTKVRWLSAGCVFERVWQLKDDIVSFFHENQCSAECEMLEDTEWLSDFAFFKDLLCHMNNLNVTMQRKNQFIDDIWAHLKAFKLKLNLFAGQLAKNDLSHFSRLNSIPSVNEEKLKNYEDGLKKLHFEFERRFQDFSAIQTELYIFTMPFNVNCEAVRSDLQLGLIELQSNNHLKQSFLNMPKFAKQDCCKLRLLSVEYRSPPTVALRSPPTRQISDFLASKRGINLLRYFDVPPTLIRGLKLESAHEVPECGVYSSLTFGLGWVGFRTLTAGTQPNSLRHQTQTLSLWWNSSFPERLC
ncbi:General transcription factor II-I repeat domain-containing protein 2 [Araneus ventricosus]|uniref:General transcription factor II-I repeat domain-containing protein 2 n=1 Tax=Araneus ventricosus TaxID=182803 RepID=A0A4Y2SGV7_ARAVE|nr:General transcription factor II-I repeat domain-containing protein 2 [Araneus ventricosus]